MQTFGIIWGVLKIRDPQNKRFQYSVVVIHDLDDFGWFGGNPHGKPPFAEAVDFLAIWRPCNGANSLPEVAALQNLHVTWLITLLKMLKDIHKWWKMMEKCSFWHPYVFKFHCTSFWTCRSVKMFQRFRPQVLNVLNVEDLWRSFNIGSRVWWAGA